MFLELVSNSLSALASRDASRSLLYSKKERKWERVERDETWQIWMQAMHRFKEKNEARGKCREETWGKKGEKGKRERKEKWTNAKPCTPLVWTTF